ncbi:hypothetical protein OEZ85_004613 [Tetradesmus obliquus]|uniref:Uncharacterized protein n=1 Tax=Tetradesmus obliquus TaxID=3088 RepID=A0ABY8UMF8_TETOB|nr:hypothetical protein OEZ85_004613 [Tetradesmus obliquus]
MTGLLVLWLTKKKHGWVPEIEEGLGQLSPLPGTSGKPMRSLQRARLLAEAWVKAAHPMDAHLRGYTNRRYCDLLAEAWVKAAHPMDAQLREAGMEWRDRAMSETQAVFCERHGIPYDPAWSRGTVNNTIDRYVVETMRLPATDRQLFITRHMSPYAPSYLVHSGSTALMYRQAADHLLQSLLTANFTRSTARPSKEALKAEAGAAAAAAAAAGGFASGVQQGSGAWDEVLPARKALVEDLDAQFEAGLRPRHTWLVISGQRLLLDLMEAAVRLAGMVGGWKVPSKASEQQPAMLATPRQLELLRAAGLPTSRRYSCLDAHRELLRHAKTHGLPELPATPSQLARMQELHIPIGSSSSSSSAESAAGPGQLTSAASAESVAAGTESAATANMLTSAEAKALLFRVQLAEERRQAEAAKQKGGKAKQGPIMAGVGGGFARRPRRHRA